MKKNISRIAALLAAAALVFGAVGCSSDDDDENTPQSQNVAVTGVTVKPETVSLEVGGTATVTATVTPSNASDSSVTWSSSDDKVATVKDGVITAVAAGSATVTVTTTDGKKTATVVVTVTEAEAGGNQTLTGSSTHDKVDFDFSSYSDIEKIEVTLTDVSGEGTDSDSWWFCTASAESEGYLFNLTWSDDIKGYAGSTEDATQISAIITNSLWIYGNVAGTGNIKVTVTEKESSTPAAGATGTAKYLYLDISTNSGDEPSYAATYSGDTLGATVSDVSTYLTDGKEFVSTAAVMSQKIAADLPVSYAVTGKNDANNSMTVEAGTFYYYGKTVFTVTASADKAATVTGIAGYFGSGKSVLNVYYTTDGGKTFTALANDSSVTAKKGVYVKDTTLDIAVAAGGTQTIELYVGKIAEKAPTAGGTVELAQIDLTIKE